MVIWLTGNTGAGKTTTAKRLTKIAPNAIHLDGDECRATINKDLSLSMEDRTENNRRIAEIARMFDMKGHFVLVSTIAPTKQIRENIKRICGCKFIYIKGGAEPSADKPYEVPDSDEILFTIYGNI